MIPRLEKSLCGCSLYTGSLILAWIYTIFSMSGVLLVTVILAFGPEILDKLQDVEFQHDGQQEMSVFVANVAFAFLLVLLLVSFFINACLLYGIYKRNHCMILPHLIFSGIAFCFLALNNLIFLFVAFTSPQLFMQFFLILLQTALAGYFWLIIYSYYKVVKDEHLQNLNVFNKL